MNIKISVIRDASILIPGLASAPTPRDSMQREPGVQTAAVQVCRNQVSKQNRCKYGLSHKKVLQRLSTTQQPDKGACL